jgi:MFS family permease
MAASTEPPPLAADAAGQARAGTGAWLGLALLLVLGLYTHTDRQIFGLQAEPLRQALGLSDLQFGLLQGVSVALFASIVGYPLGWLADRFDRRWVLAACIATWAAALVGCGMARDFNELFIASAIVGAGEAGLLPITYAMVPELFRGRQRQLANSLFIVAGRLMVGLVLALCGWMIHAIDLWKPALPAAWQALPTWRLTFFAVALPALLLIPLIAALPRGRHAGGPAPKPQPSPAVLPFLRANRFTYASFYVGVGLLVFGFGATGAFLPVVATRQMGVTPLEMGNAFGAASFIAALAGLLITNVGLKRLGNRFGNRLPLFVLAAAAFASAVFTACFWFATTPLTLFVLVGAQQTFLMAGSMVFPTVLQDMTPAPLRARLISLLITFNMVMGSLSPALVGAMSDWLKPRADGLLLAMSAVGAAALALSAVFSLLCSRRYAATIAAARGLEDADGMRPPISR